MEQLLARTSSKERALFGRNYQGTISLAAFKRPYVDTMDNDDLG